MNSDYQTSIFKYTHIPSEQSNLIDGIEKAPPFNAGLQSLLGISCPAEEESTVLVKKAMTNDKIPIPK